MVICKIYKVTHKSRTKQPALPIPCMPKKVFRNSLRSCTHGSVAQLRESPCRPYWQLSVVAGACRQSVHDSDQGVVNCISHNCLVLETFVVVVHKIFANRTLLHEVIPPRMNYFIIWKIGRTQSGNQTQTVRANLPAF